MIDIEPLLRRLAEHNATAAIDQRLCAVLCCDGSGHFRPAMSIPHWIDHPGFGVNLRNAEQALDAEIRKLWPDGIAEPPEDRRDVHRPAAPLPILFSSIADLIACCGGSDE